MTKDLYDVAAEVTHAAGMDWRDPRTGQLHPAPEKKTMPAVQAGNSVLVIAASISIDPMVGRITEVDRGMATVEARAGLVFHVPVGDLMYEPKKDWLVSDRWVYTHRS